MTDFDNLTYLHGKPQGTGLLKANPEDFVVIEDLGFEPDGEGEHILVRILKNGCNTRFVADALAKFLKIHAREVSFAGQKDKHAVTEQWLCARVPGNAMPDLSKFELEGCKVLEYARHKRKLRLGALKGNAFTLMLREVTDREDVEKRLKDLVNQEGNENWSKIRDEMGLSMEEGCGIYRTPELMQKTVDKLAELQERFKRVRITDTSSVFNTDLLYTIELGHGLNVAECMAHSALARKESRGAHQRLDEGCTERDDVNFLKHTLAWRDADGTTRLDYSDVKITTLPPAKRVYGAEAEAAEKKEKANG